MRHVRISLAALVTLAACGGGSPTASRTTDVAGTWSGDLVLRSATPAGNCYADLFTPSLPLTFSSTLEVTQNGSDILAHLTGVYVPLNIHIDLPFHGTISGSTLSLPGTGQASCSDFACASGRTVHVCLQSWRLDAGVISSGSGRVLSGTYTEVEAVTDLASGASLGMVTLSAELGMRQ